MMRRSGPANGGSCTWIFSKPVSTVNRVACIVGDCARNFFHTQLKPSRMKKKVRGTNYKYNLQVQTLCITPGHPNREKLRKQVSEAVILAEGAVISAKSQTGNNNGTRSESAQKKKSPRTGRDLEVDRSRPTTRRAFLLRRWLRTCV